MFIHDLGEQIFKHKTVGIPASYVLGWLGQTHRRSRVLEFVLVRAESRDSVTAAAVCLIRSLKPMKSRPTRSCPNQFLAPEESREVVKSIARMARLRIKRLPLRIVQSHLTVVAS